MQQVLVVPGPDKLETVHSVRRRSLFLLHPCRCKLLQFSSGQGRSSARESFCQDLSVGHELSFFVVEVELGACQVEASVAMQAHVLPWMLDRACAVNADDASITEHFRFLVLALEPITSEHKVRSVVSPPG